MEESSLGSQTETRPESATESCVEDRGQGGTENLDELDRVAAAQADKMSADCRGKVANVDATESSMEDLAAQLALDGSPTGHRILGERLVIGRASLDTGGETGWRLAIRAKQDAGKAAGRRGAPKRSPPGQTRLGQIVGRWAYGRFFRRVAMGRGGVSRSCRIA